MEEGKLEGKEREKEREGGEERKEEQIGSHSELAKVWGTNTLRAGVNLYSFFRVYIICEKSQGNNLSPPTASLPAAAASTRPTQTVPQSGPQQDCGSCCTQDISPMQMGFRVDSPPGPRHMLPPHLPLLLGSLGSEGIR